MGQLSQAFVKAMLTNAQAKRHTPLTCWEEEQLATAWLRGLSVAMKLTFAQIYREYRREFGRLHSVRRAVSQWVGLHRGKWS